MNIRLRGSNIPALLALTALLIGTTACTQVPPLTVALDGVAITELARDLDIEMPEVISEAQAAALADGEVSDSELQIAAEGWESCLEEAGYEATVTMNGDPVRISILITPTETTSEDEERMDEADHVCQEHHIVSANSIYERQLYDGMAPFG